MEKWGDLWSLTDEDLEELPQETQKVDSSVFEKELSQHSTNRNRHQGKGSIEPDYVSSASRIASTT